MQDVMAQVKARWVREAQISDGHTPGATPQDRLDAYILIADRTHKELWEALLGARLEAFTVPDLPLAAKLNGWISDLIRVWHGRGPEETSGDSGLKHYANAVRKRRIQMMHEEEGCPEVEISEF